MEDSTKLIYEYIKMTFDQTTPIYFEENVIIDRFLELIEEEKVLIEDLQRRQQTMQENIALYQQEAPKMSARQREANEADLMRVQQQYLQVEQAAQSQLVKKQQDLTKMMREDMDKAIVVLKDELNLDFILLYEEGGQIIYANTDFDITERMVTMLNESRENPTAENAPKEVVSDSSAND